MSKYKRGHQQSVDGNELEIIKVLEIEDCFVVRGMDDILVYAPYDYLYQIEIKTESPFNKNGTLKVGKIKDSQYKMLCHANSYYAVIWTKDQAIDLIIRGQLNPNEWPIMPRAFKKNYKEWLTPKELNRLRQKTWWNLE